MKIPLLAGLAALAALAFSPTPAGAQSSPPPTPEPPAPPAATPGSSAAPPAPAPAAPAAVPEPAAPAAPAPVPAPAPPAAAPLPPVGSAPAAPSTQDRARVLIRVDREQASLELKPFGAFVEWRRACLAPCGDWIVVEGMEARVVAPGMTASKSFRIRPGQGTVTLSVDGGSERAKTWGQIALASGLPVALAGMATYAYGAYDDRGWMKTSGGITASLGAALVLTSLPLLLLGTTEVRENEGKLVAGDPPSGF